MAITTASASRNLSALTLPPVFKRSSDPPTELTLHFRSSIPASPEAAKLPVELGTAEDEGRRAAVRAVVGVVDQMPLCEQALNLLGSQPLSGLHCRLARKHVEQVVQQVA